MMVLHLSHHPLLYIHVTYIQPGTDYTQCSNESTVLFSSVLVSTCRDADLRPVLRFPVSVSAFLAVSRRQKQHSERFFTHNSILPSFFFQSPALHVTVCSVALCIFVAINKSIIRVNTFLTIVR